MKADGGAVRRGMWAAWPVRRRIAASLSVVGMLLIGMVAISGLLLLQLRDAQDDIVVRLYTALSGSNKVLVGMVDSETAVRGYALTGATVVLDPYEKADAPWSAHAWDTVRPLIDDPATLQAIDAVQRSATAWHDQWALPVIAARRDGIAPTVTQVEDGKRLFDQVRKDYSVLRADLLLTRTEATATLASRTTAQFVAAVIIALLALASGLVLWILLKRWVSDPVEALTAETRTVSGDDLTHVVTVEGPPEFVRLGQDVDGMRLRLVSQIAAFEAAGQEIAAAQRRLEEQAADLERSNRELEQFAYVASHDLQEPLRKVTSFCQMLERRYSGQLDERADQYIEFAVDGAKRMQQLINDLLQFSRVGRGTRDFAPVVLGDVVETALVNLDTAIEESGAVVTHDPLPTSWGSASLLTQLMQNLIGNAIKFRRPGAVPHVHLSARPAGDQWELSCADDGIGIEPQYAERIFLIFQRLHAKDAYAGTGIGLALCQKIVEYHGGQILADTSVPVGTTFRFTLPRVPATPEPVRAHAPGELLSKG